MIGDRRSTFGRMDTDRVRNFLQLVFFAPLVCLMVGPGCTLGSTAEAAKRPHVFHDLQV